MGKSHRPCIAILGGGPMGVESLLAARRLDFPATLYERAAVGEHVHQWAHLRMFTPFAANTTRLGRELLAQEHRDRDLPADDAILTGEDFLLHYLVPLSESRLLRAAILSETEVVQVGRMGRLCGDPGPVQTPFVLLLRDGTGKERYEQADVILDCTGTLGTPRWLGLGGVPALGELDLCERLVYTPEDVAGSRQAEYANRTVFVVGAGLSAATTVVALADLAEREPATWIIWATRGERSQPIPRIANDPFRERDRLAARANALATRGEGNLEFHPRTWVEAIEPLEADAGFRVRVLVAGQPRTWEVERLIANVGYRADFRLAEELMLGNRDPGQVETAEPGYYVLGAKSQEPGGAFWLRQGHEQIVQVFAQIRQRSELYGHRGPFRAVG